MIEMDDIRDYLEEHLRIELDTEAPAFTGSVYLIATLKLDGKVISRASTALPDISQLKRAEYNDY